METPFWFQDAVVYELHVKTFQDSDGDGVGDFAGLRQRLDYFVELGVTALWLLPFYPSPLRDDGYDIADYYSVHPRYGTLEDFHGFLNDAHARGLRVITELVLNHTSDQNAWFQRARRAAPGTPERDFYVWGDDPTRYSEARVIFQDFEASNWTWDPVAKSHFWHRFYGHQPDLNFDNPAVGDELLRVIDFWLEMGVDGLRLDAVPYLYERDGTNCENLPETHAFLRRLRTHIDERFPGRLLLAEANQWPEDAVAYFGAGDECHMVFHFPLMPRLFMALQMEDRYPIVDIMEQTPAIPPGCQWAIFLRNHDELTLEMVTDEERDYMVRVYAQDPRARINLGIRRRLAPLLGNNRRKIELINSLLLSMPGTPIIYYGDEIGMGDNFHLGDRDGVRTPMQWNADRNAGFSKANPQRLYLPAIIDPEYHYESVNVENQRGNLSSLWWWTRRLLAVRRQSPAFTHGAIEFLPAENAKVLAYVRRHEDESVLVVANLSRFPQAVDLDLSAYAGRVPEELFGRARFPVIGMAPVPFTVGPHGFYWLKLCTVETTRTEPQWTPPTLAVHAEWTQPLSDALARAVLPRYLRTCDWFVGGGRSLREVRVVQALPIGFQSARWLMAEVNFTEGSPQYYMLPLEIVSGESAERFARKWPQATLAFGCDGAAVVDALYRPRFRTHLLRIFAEPLVQRGLRTDPCREIDPHAPALSSRLTGSGHSNTTIIYGDAWFLKIFRRFEVGPNPDVELTRRLNGCGFTQGPRYGGALYMTADGGEGAAALLVSYIGNLGDAWSYTVDAISRFFDRALESPGADMKTLIGGVFPDRARQLGRCTAQMHVSLIDDYPGSEFSPEPFTSNYRRSRYQAMRDSFARVLRVLKRHLPAMSEVDRLLANEFTARSGTIIEIISTLLHHRIDAQKIRVHGDFHLGKALNTGKDFVLIDFEGEPRRPLGERILKRCCLADVAGMLRSFAYAAAVALRRRSPEDAARLDPWAKQWLGNVEGYYLEAYLENASVTALLPRDPTILKLLVRVFMLDKAIYEVGYELANRPDWVGIPLRGVISLCETAKT
jgi:maltose alpha-D-glucosyltransferase/alpha-amylase